MSLNDISKEEYEILGKLFVCGLLKTFKDARFDNDTIPFWKVDAEFALRGVAYPDQTMVMRQLAAVGLVEFVNFWGWRLLPIIEPNEPAHAERTDPVLEEFGHACDGCARCPCDKAKAGEPDGDCWEYERR